MENTINIPGKKIILRDMIFEDLDPLAYWLDPRHKWHQFNGPYYSPKPLEKIPDEIGKYAVEIASGERPKMREFLIIAHKEANSLIGMVTRYWISIETNWMALGLLIYDEQNWSGGIGTEALSLWCDYLFNQDPDLLRLDLRTWSGNIGMMKVAEKVGFRKEAIFRKARIVHSEVFDGLGYGILREEWEQKNEL